MRLGGSAGPRLGAPAQAQQQQWRATTAPAAPSRPACTRRCRDGLDLTCYYKRSAGTVQAPTQREDVRSQPKRGSTGRSGPPKRYQTRNGRTVLPSSRSVKFHVRYKTDFGQEVFLVGNCGALGDWDVLRGVKLTWSPGHIWEGSVELPAGMHIQYKYVVRNCDGSVVRWQEGANVSLELPGGPAEALALDVEDSWNKSKQVKRILASGTPVRFNLRLKVEFGQVLLVVGSCATLGNWNVDHAVRLNWQEGHIWEAPVELPAGELVSYKYVVRNADGTIDAWQPGDNLQMEVPVAQGHNGRRRGVLVLDTWTKAAAKKAARRAGFGGGGAAPSWRSTPYASVPAGSPAAHAGADVDGPSSAAAHNFYSLMDPQGAGSGGLASRVEAIRDPVVQRHDPSVMQHWTDKPRFGGLSQQHQAHQDPWGGGHQEQPAPAAARVSVPQPALGSSPEEFARWQALQSVMAALEHSSELDHWVDDPTDPRMLAADRRLAALTASLGTSSGAVAMA